MGFTPQKTIKKVYEKSPKAVKQWPDQTYHGIKRLAVKEKAEIYCGATKPVLVTITNTVVSLKPGSGLRWQFSVESPPDKLTFFLSTRTSPCNHFVRK